MARTWKPHKAWTEYPLRVCRWMNECRICKRVIESGQEYYDGGFNIRAHKSCVDIGKRKQEFYAEAIAKVKP